ncbi:MAG: response regulator [Candidatus Tectimicrobiota bacterium]
MLLPAPARRRFQVLIIDDNPAQLRTLSDLLTEEGFCITGCATAAAALAHVQRTTPEVAVLDLRLPDQPGMHVLEQLLAHAPRLRVVIHTGYGSFDSAKEALNCGAFAYVEKAGDPEELVRHVHRACQAYLDHYVADLEAAVAARTAALQASEARFRDLIEGSLQGIVIQRAWQPLFVNQAYAAIHGYATPEEVLQCPTIARFVAPHHRARLQRHQEAHLRGETAPVYYEYQGLRRDGSAIWLENKVRVVIWEGVAALQSTIVEITERKRMEQEILAISEREQQRLGRDLHDGLGQLLTGIAFLSKGVEEALQEQQRPEAQEVSRIVALVNEAITTSRDLARGLYPVALQSGDLPGALHILAAGAAQVFRSQVEVTCNVSLLLADQTTAIHLYRIVQEAVNNALQHGKASAVHVGLQYADGVLHLTVTDNGCGLPDGVGTRPGMGLRIMRSRARMIGATFDVQRGAAGGTAACCVLPVEILPSQGD